MPEEDLLQKINTSTLDEPLKAALGELLQAAQALPARMAGSIRMRNAYILEMLVKEVLEPPEDTLWWEVELGLLGMQAVPGEAATTVRQQIEQLKPLLAAHFGENEAVTLREITSETVFGICLLSDTLSEPKRNFVATNAVSLAQALFAKVAWYRAIYAGKAAVGFLMIVDNPEEHEYFLWRFMIAEPFHGRGYGRQALERLVEYVRTRPGASELRVSCGQGEGSPQGFYEKFGFKLTGEMIGHEVVLSIPIKPLDGDENA